ncbi:MAG: helix-turn-helix domain-containing protein [Clostridia bacterium]|nr:helix-turn-helix domain-containing protein [Clostridia bacterium]
MDIYESLNYISKLAFPKIKFNWEKWSINEDAPIFKISIFTNAVEDYIIGNYENGLKAIIKTIEKKQLPSKTEIIAEQLLVVLADSSINYHSDTCKNKPQIACKLYKKYDVFRKNAIKYAPYLPRLISNLIARSFFDLDFKTVKDVCENCIPKYVVDTELYHKLLEKLYDEFTYNHSFENLVTEDNALLYWKIAEYINQTIPKLNFYQVRDGKIIFEIKQDIDELKSLKALISLVEKEHFWVDVKAIPNIIEFEYIYPNGSNGDMIKYILEEYGETYEIGSNKWYGKFSKKYLDLFEMFAVVAPFITQDNRFTSLFTEHYTPSLLGTKLWERHTSKSYCFKIFISANHMLQELKLDRRAKRRELYAQLIREGQTSPKWKSEAQLYALVSSFYPDAIYQYHSDWLDMQSLDIFIPSISTGIEYQGIQHYKPIEHFGGEKHFLHQQANDLKKKQLCEENGINLIEWPYSKEVTETEVRKVLSISDDVTPQKSENVSYIKTQNKKQIKSSKSNSNSVKLEVINKHLKQRIPMKELSGEYGISESDIEQWINDYLFYGEAKFTSPKAKYKSSKIDKKPTPKISRETKLEIINKYLSGTVTQKELAEEYNVSASSVGLWISSYQKYGEKVFD